jgi:colanic acid biosynthesis glycosyl transferase WcaI
MLKQGALMRALYWLERFAYAKAARVSGITPGMLQAFRSKGVADSKLVLFPNGVVMPDPASRPAPGLFRARNGFAANDFLAVYSGNLGVKQGLDVLVEAARTLRDDRIRIVICGEGAQRAKLEGTIRTYGLRNVTMLPLQSDSGYRELLVDADLCVITQQSGSGGCFFPSKLLTVADEESELVLAMRDGKFGMNVAPGQPQKLSAALEMLAGDQDLLRTYASAGREYVSRFEMERVLTDFSVELEKLAAEGNPAKPRVARPKVTRAGFAP